MTVLKIIYKALVMVQSLRKVEELNGDREPLFSFFKLLLFFNEVCVCACLFTLFMSPFLLLFTYSLSLLRLLSILF